MLTVMMVSRIGHACCDYPIVALAAHTDNHEYHENGYSLLQIIRMIITKWRESSQVIDDHAGSILSQISTFCLSC